MYRFILFYFVLYICIYVAPWSCEARHLVPLYVHTCSGMTIKLNLNLNLNYPYYPPSEHRKDLLKNGTPTFSIQRWAASTEVPISVSLSLSFYRRFYKICIKCTQNMKILPGPWCKGSVFGRAACWRADKGPVRRSRIWRGRSLEDR